MKTNLPTGTVTFLFTDIQGSTPLWEQMPGEMEKSVAQHHALLRQAIETNDGNVTQVIGDSFQAVFSLPAQGLAAAVLAQRLLQSADWEKTGSLKVRMGLHTGPAELDPLGNAPYAVSHTLNRAARVMSAAQGGQVLLSQEAADLVIRNLPEGLSLKDLGEHHLKGMQWLEHLYQVVAADLQQEFPPLPTSITHPNNLPIQLTSFIGREKEIVEVSQLIANHRLVTLTGSGGTGKTRLALQVAGQILERYTNGIWFVELASLGNPDLVPRTTIAVLGMQESTSQSLMAQLQNYLKDKQILLLLDNCEHLLDDCARMADALLRACPKLKILASSREALGVDGETAYRVPSLPAPDPRSLPPLEELTHFAAVQLFAERAAAAQPGFAITNTNAQAVAQVCRRLDGIPLAIELAAARISVLSVEQIATRLDSRFRLLTGGSRTALPRQQTLRASIDWSFSLLDEREQRLLMRLSVFYGGWTLDAANSVCSFDGVDEYEVIDGLAKLANKSLILVDKEASGSNRYRMLETIRQYAREKLLDSGDAEEVQNHHLDYFAQLAESAEPHLRGPQQVEWLDRLETELDNLRAALEWALEEAPQKGLLLAASAYWMWHIRGYRVEGEHWLDQLFEKLHTDSPSPAALPLLAKARVYQGYLQLATGGVGSRTTGIVEQARELADQLGDEGKLIQINAIHALAWDAFHNNQTKLGFELYQKGLEMAQVANDHFLVAEFLQNLASNEPDRIKGRKYAEQNLAIRNELGDLDGQMMAYLIMSNFDYMAGNMEQASQMIKESLLIARKVNNRWGIMSGQYGIGFTYCETGDFTRSIEYFQQALANSLDYGEYFWTIWAFNALGHAFVLSGDWLSAKRHFLQAIEAARANQSVDWEVRSCINLAEAAWAKRDFSLAERYYRAAELAGQKRDVHDMNGLISYGLGKASFSSGDTQAAEACFRHSLEVFLRLDSRQYLTFSLEALSALSATRQGQAARAARLGGASERWRVKYYNWANYQSFLVTFDLETQLTPVRLTLGEAEFKRLYDEGQAMTLEQAVAYAMEEPQ